MSPDHHRTSPDHRRTSPELPPDLVGRSPDHHRTSPECRRTTTGSRRKVTEIPSASPEGRRTFAGIHQKHHRLIVPYAIGALYNHPLEGLLLDTLGGALSFLVSGMTAPTAVIFFCFAVIKTVDDHSRLWLPVNIFHLFFQNNTAYHDVHHQLQGLKYNYSQSFFSIWDRLLGTHMPYHLVKLPEGGFEAQLKKD
ncbi:sphinganine C4-monooxygenase 1-like [Citrus clementina]|uniref:sphinganine C4-monooxygenase 1-like n=1 Tax=Citrus clementina TaxID=85681 RepID=UPI000CED327E|nr:sphinganine C4-monooxygenase 1-like [Citrus x clementina]